MGKQKKSQGKDGGDNTRQDRQELWQAEDQNKDQTRGGKHEPGYEYGKIRC